MPSQRLLIEKNFPIFFRKLLGVLGLTKAISKIFRVAYAVRGEPPKKKKYVLRHAIFFCGSQPHQTRLQQVETTMPEPDGSANPHRSIVVGWAMLRWLIHPPNLHQSPTITSESASHSSISQPATNKSSPG